MMALNNSRFVIELQDVSKAYAMADHAVSALHNINLQIPSGSRIAIQGKSGAGKTTLLHIVGTLDRPSSGKVLLNGTDVSDMPDSVLSNFRNGTIGFVFQMNNLLPEFSALENVMMPGLISGANKAEISSRAEYLLKAVGLGHRLTHRPGELSGGEQQRVAIARALLMSPPILLADEPTGNLDQKTSSEIVDLMFSLCESHKMTLLLVTHDPDLAARMPQQINMEDGRIVNER